MKVPSFPGNNQKSFASTTERVFAAGIVLAAGASALVVSYFNPVKAGFFPQCPLYAIFGLHCPGCGLTRGFHALFQGDIPAALGYNVLLPFYLLILSYLILSLLLTAIRGRGLSWKVFHPAALYGFLIASLIFAVLRNLPVYPFNILAP